MATTLYSGVSNDIEIANGDFKMLDSRNAYGEILREAILTRRGELQLDLDKGIPYFETVFTSVAYENYWKDAVRKRILAFPFVRNIVKFTTKFDSSTKNMDFSVTIQTDNGLVSVSQ